MSRWAHITIAGVQLKDVSGVWCRAEFVDAEGLKGTVAASNQVALDFSVHTQWSDRGKAAVHFGVNVFQLPIAKIDAIIEATETAIRAGDTFVVAGADDDGVDDVNVRATLDYQAQGGKPYKRATFSGAYVRDVVFRFISTGAEA